MRNMSTTGTLGPMYRFSFKELKLKDAIFFILLDSSQWFWDFLIWIQCKFFFQYKLMITLAIFYFICLCKAFWYNMTRSMQVCLSISFTKTPMKILHISFTWVGCTCTFLLFRLRLENKMSLIFLFLWVVGFFFGGGEGWWGGVGRR